ncbi:MAG: hypothetical protein HW421_1882, partial [Ignavibacteria bacterium]|nr:hypothetical protein [Ignavibacteria bacterium]
MYFTGYLEIDPSQQTLIKSEKPDKLFGKLLKALTLGQISEKKEWETFSAVSILEQLNHCFRSMNIHNLIRISIDDYNFYLDESGREDDLEDGINHFEKKIDPLESEIFNTIFMVLEHLDNELKYIIELRIHRKHKIGEYPIKIVINALLSDFKLRPGETRQVLVSGMKQVFTSQETYDNYTKGKRADFEKFLSELEICLRNGIKIDDIKRRTVGQIIRPKRILENPEFLRYDHHSQPAFYGYFGLSDNFFYTWQWAELCYEHNIYLNEFLLVDETGKEILKVDEEGFYAGSGSTMDPYEAFAPPIGVNTTIYSGNEYDDLLKGAMAFTAFEIGLNALETT